MNEKKDKRTGRFIKSAKYIKRICENCKTIFFIKESLLKRGGGKCCNRKCVDENKKITYLAEKNPMFGKTPSEKVRKLASARFKKIWNSSLYRQEHKRKMDKFFAKAAVDGTWERAIKKREKTLLEKYGIKHNWEGVYGERPCDITFVKKFGMSGVEFLNKLKPIRNTSIEQKVMKIFKKSNINYIREYKLQTKYYDFYLPEYNVLIECDGDYWHGKGIRYNQLDKIQKITRKNDIYKNKLAKKANLILFRFWETVINKKDFDIQLLENLWQQ